jgi:hypothetical protein
MEQTFLITIRHGVSLDFYMLTKKELKRKLNQFCREQISCEAYLNVTTLAGKVSKSGDIFKTEIFI